jgi:hypothetical protein
MFIIRKLNSNDYWTAVVGSNDGVGIDHVWGNAEDATEFHSSVDATMVARLATRDGFPSHLEIV